MFMLAVVSLLGLISTVLAAEWNLNLEDNGKIFQQKFNFDTLENVKIIKVPAHGNFQKVEILSDFDRGFSARRIDSLKKCFISILEKDEQTPSELERSLRLANSTFTTGELYAKEYNALPLYEMTSKEVGEKIAQHCKGVKLIFTERFLDSDINKKAAEIIKGLESRRHSTAGRIRRVSLPHFNFCKADDPTQYFRCPSKSKLKMNCTFKHACSCIYDVRCTLKSRFFECDKRHVKDSVICCKVKCNELSLL